MSRSRIVIIGLGTIGLELVSRLPREMEVVCIDRDPDRSLPASVRKGCTPPRRVTGDATSRLVLEDAGVGSADVVVITTASERVNLEVGRVVREKFGVPRVLSVAISPAGTASLEALNIEVVNLFSQSASALRNRIEQRAKTAHGFGLERGEIMEVEVHPSSRLVGKTMNQLAPERWRVAIIYREDNILLPSDDTVLKGRDRVVLTGEPSVLRTVAEMLTFRFERFPLEYGSSLAVCLCGGEDEMYRREVEYLLEALPLEQVVLLGLPGAETGQQGLLDLVAGGEEPPIVRVGSPDRWTSTIATLAEDPRTRPGLVIFSREAVLGRGIRQGATKRLLYSLSQDLGCPVLLAAGTFPYRRVALPCVPGLDLEHVLESVFEMSSFLNHQTRGLLVRPSRYLSAADDARGFDRQRSILHEMSLVYRTSVDVVELDGNPVEAVLSALDGSELLVADTAGWTHGSWMVSALNPEPVWHIVRRAPLSTLLVPPEEESL